MKILRNEMPSYLSINFFNQRQEPISFTEKPGLSRKKLQTKNKKWKREYIRATALSIRPNHKWRLPNRIESNR